MRAGKQAKQTAEELGIHLVTPSEWLRQDDIDKGCTQQDDRRVSRDCERVGSACHLTVQQTQQPNTRHARVADKRARLRLRRV